MKKRSRLAEIGDRARRGAIAAAIRSVLGKQRGNISATARELGIDRGNLFRHAQHCGMDLSAEAARIRRKNRHE